MLQDMKGFKKALFIPFLVLFVALIILFIGGLLYALISWFAQRRRIDS